MLKRELLLREMQHRVKNNFQTILSMIQLRGPALPTQSGRDFAAKLADAIVAMSLAHDQLSPERSGEVLDLGAYLRALAASFAATMDKVVMEVKCDEVKVTIEQAVPVGLIVNELVTNSLKHAFGEGGGSIRIELHATGSPGYATVRVADDGRGLAEAGSRHGASGLKLVRALVEQIRGELSQSSSTNGTTTQLRFAPRDR